VTTTVAALPDERSLWARFASDDPLVVVPRLLAMLVVPTGGGWPTLVGVIVAATVAATPALFRNPAPWLAVGTIRLAGDFDAWHGIDDHEVLISYVCVAFGLALWCEDPARIARRSLPVLVGLTMGFATAWKIGSGQFLDGDTMRHILLTDHRFELVASWLGGTGEAAIAANRAAVRMLRDSSGPESVQLIEPVRLTVLAYVLTAGALILEGWLAIAFLKVRSSARLRAALLSSFCVATYLIVPVSRFGLILLTAAYAGSEGRRDRRMLFSAMVFCVVWPVVWTALGGTK
jgi:hypothetical protein